MFGARGHHFILCQCLVDVASSDLAWWEEVRKLRAYIVCWGEGPRMKGGGGGGGGQSEPAPTRVALRMEDGTWTGNTVLVCSCQLANKGCLAMYY